jgi:hypothetical protein
MCPKKSMFLKSRRVRSCGKQRDTSDSRWSDQSLAIAASLWAGSAAGILNGRGLAAARVFHGLLNLALERFVFSLDQKPGMGRDRVA